MPGGRLAHLHPRGHAGPHLHPPALGSSGLQARRIAWAPAAAAPAAAAAAVAVVATAVGATEAGRRFGMSV